MTLIGVNMAIRKIDSSNLIIERTFDRKQVVVHGNSFVNERKVSNSSDNKVSNKELVMRKMSKIGNIIRRNENFNLSVQDQNTILNIIAAE